MMIVITFLFYPKKPKGICLLTGIQPVKTSCRKNSAQDISCSKYHMKLYKSGQSHHFFYQKVFSTTWLSSSNMRGLRTWGDA